MSSIANTALEGNAGERFVLTSLTARLEHQTRSVITTKSAAFAYAIYENALDLGVEPDLAATGSGYIVEFVASDGDRDKALALAMGGVH